VIKRVITDGTLQAFELWLHNKDQEIPLKRCTTAASETAMERLEWEPAKRLSIPAGQQSRYFDNSLVSVANWSPSPSLNVEVISRRIARDARVPCASSTATGVHTGSCSRCTKTNFHTSCFRTDEQLEQQQYFLPNSTTHNTDKNTPPVPP
jgi:hypothetical protein